MFKTDWVALTEKNRRRNGRLEGTNLFIPRKQAFDVIKKSFVYK